MAAAVQVRGIREVQAAFRKVDKDLPKALRPEFLEVARSVVRGVQQKMPWRTGRAIRSVKPRASQRGAAIAVGGTAAPYYPWLDFGGTTGKGHRPGQRFSGSVVRPWMGSPGDGRYLYPTISEQTEDIEKAAEDAVLKVARSAGLEVK
jgi:hypothetical protein